MRRATVEAPVGEGRWAMLGEQRITLLGDVPQDGSVLDARFSLPAARGARRPLTCAALRRGVVVVSTMPNIGRHACMAQIVELELHLDEQLPGARLVHISSDEAKYWREVDEFHIQAQSPGYTLHGATPASRAQFAAAFGVGVEGHHRIAHGLFALNEGVFVRSEIPLNQMGVPAVLCFLRETRRARG